MLLKLNSESYKKFTRGSIDVKCDMHCRTTKIPIPFSVFTDEAHVLKKRNGFQKLGGPTRLWRRKTDTKSHSAANMVLTVFI